MIRRLDAKTGRWISLIDALRQMDIVCREVDSENDLLVIAAALILDTVRGSGALVWYRDSDSGFRLRLTNGIDPAIIADKEFLKTSEVIRHQLAAVGQVFQTGAAACFESLASCHTSAAQEATEFDTLLQQHSSLLAPIVDDERVLAVVTVFQEPADGRELDVDLAAVVSICSKLSDWYSKRAIRSLRTEVTKQQRFSAAVSALGRHLDEQQMSFEVVNRLRHYFAADRVTLTICHGDTSQVKAISGQPTFDRRSNVVRRLEALASEVVTTGEAFWYPNTSDTAPSVQTKLDKYLEVSNTRSIGMLPLAPSARPADDPEDLAQLVHGVGARKQDPIGMLIVEGIDHDVPRHELEPQWKLIEPAVVSAVDNARKYNGLFLMPVWRSLGLIANLFRGRRRPKAILACSTLAVTITALVLIPGDFKVRSEGTIQPSRRAQIYAEAEGTVSELLVQDGDVVKKGDLLVRLANPDLNSRIAEVEGSLKEAEAQLQTVTLQRIGGEPKSEADELALVQRGAGLEARIAGLRNQVALHREKKDQMAVISPMPGQIVAWELGRRLAGRPVVPGVALMTVADLDGRWELELRVPDKLAGYLRSAWARRNQTEQPLRVSFVLASDPERVRYGVVRTLAQSTDMIGKAGSVLRVYVDIDSNEDDKDQLARPGTEAIAHVHCGRRAIGYCKLYEFFDWLQRTLFTLT